MGASPQVGVWGGGGGVSKTWGKAKGKTAGGFGGGGGGGVKQNSGKSQGKTRGKGVRVFRVARTERK